MGHLDYYESMGTDDIEMNKEIQVWKNIFFKLDIYLYFDSA